MDVNVRVIYDFEYTTKEGKDVKIREGEKLYLIKKTNDDWWQVIRTTGRPFYVPASYVTEIPNQKPVDDISGEMRIQIEEESNKPSMSKRTEQTNFIKSASLINLVSEKLHEPKKGNEYVTNQDTKAEGYSHVNVVGKNRLIVNEEDIPLSSSLEQLSQQIQDKSSYLNSLGEKNSLKINDLVKHLRKESTVCNKNINYGGNNLKRINKEEETHDEDSKNKLHYKGSFKTKHERQKWAENYVAMHTMGEENLSSSNEAVNEDKGEENQKNKESKNSSTENIEFNTKFGNSEKGSTDSLLDVDTQLSIQEGSICTTASDSLLQTSDTSDEEYAKILRERLQTSVSQTENEKKKPALSRNRRVESCRLRFPMRGISPPIPDTDQQPTRKLFAGWSEYTFADGRTFFYNCQTGEKSWKPPRRRCNTDETKSQTGKDGSTYTLYSDSSSPLLESEELQTTVHKGVSKEEGDSNKVPTGWRYHEDEATGYSCYINVLTGARWFSSKDDEGRKYYFEENSNYSFWTLPAVDDTLSTQQNVRNTLSDEDVSDSRIYSNLPILPTNSLVTSAIDTNVTDKKFFADRPTKAKSMIIVDVQKNEDQTPPVSKNWPQLWDGHMCILKEGPLNKTKITEHGKRVRKNWSSSHVVLTELFLLFFKDIKSFSALRTGGGRPELCVDLNGALIDRGDKISSRKNVYIISTVLGLQVLIQNDCTQQADLWLLAIQSAIKSLPSGFDSCPRLTRSTIQTQSPENELNKKYYKVTRTKSMKNKNKDGSMEDLTVSPAERQTKIKARLKKFFHRRPTVESLVKKGIWKDEAAFGCFLEQAAGNELPRIPLFVQRCIACIEKSEENMKTDGLYRASGNLSQVQKIRLQVDQNNLSVIEEEEDVHVLTGALKLFFRELKEPLIPFHAFHKAIKASNNHSKKEKISQFREIVRSLPTANHDTLKFLLQHLLRVTKYREFNRMHIPNVAIVFGPTLMWPEQESMNMALDLMQQNLVIECFLLEFDHIFK